MTKPLIEPAIIRKLSIQLDKVKFYMISLISILKIKTCLFIIKLI